MPGLISAGKIVNSGPVVIASRSGHYRQTLIRRGGMLSPGTLSRGKPNEYSKNNNIHGPDGHYKWHAITAAGRCGPAQPASRDADRRTYCQQVGPNLGWATSPSRGDRTPREAAAHARRHRHPAGARRPVTDTELLRRADWIRLQTIDLIRQAGLGHYSSTFSCAELVATLYYRALRLRPQRAAWADRDRFLLGKGHVATGLWPVLADLGFYPQDWLRQFGKVGSPLNDHPNMKLAHGIDFSSGSLGHNLSVGAGMALGARLTGRDYRTFVLTGDGELQEGQVWEAAMAASPLQAGQPGRDRGRERLLRGRPDVAGDQHRAAGQAVRGVRLDGQGDRRERRRRGQVRPSTSCPTRRARRRW